MAKKSQINRDDKRKALIGKYADRRAELRKRLNDPEVSYEEKLAIQELKYILSHPAVTCAIPATRKAAHMADNLGAARGRLPDATQRRRMERLWAGL